MTPVAEESAPFRFSASALPEHARLAGLRDVLRHSMLGVEFEPLSDPFFADLCGWACPGFGVVWIAHSLARVGRTPELVADGNDSLVLSIPDAPSVASQLDREVTIEPGDAVLFSAARVGTVTCSSGAGKSLVLYLSRAELLPLIRDVDAALMIRIPATSPALRLLRHYAEIFAATADLPPPLQHVVVRHVYDLVAVALGATKDAKDAASKRGVRAARLHAAKAFALRNLGRHGLTAAAIAAHLRVTPRYVHILFEDENESLSQFLLRQRLLRAWRILKNPNLADRPISLIAFDVGFGDLSYFNRTFRRRFGATPSQIRAAALGRGG